MNNRTRLRLLLLLAAMLVVGCLSGCRSAEWREYRLFCGQSFDNGTKEVTPEEWERFCDEVVAPEFPDGFTVCDASGRWLQEGEIPVREKTKILLIFAPDSRQTRDAVERIATRYRARFQQESVLIVRQDVEVEFNTGED